LRAFISQQQTLFDNLNKKLVDAGLLSAEEAKSARPALELRIFDYRGKSLPTLPVLENPGSTVKIRMTGGANASNEPVG